MTDTSDYVMTTAESSAISRGRDLANLPVENLHQSYLTFSLAPWFKRALPSVREALRINFERGQETQREVARVYAQVQSIENFAEPLLNAALAARGWIDANPRTYGIKHVRLLSNLVLFFAEQQIKLVDPLIQLVWPGLLTPESLELNLVESITHQSLLQAALQNFELSETIEGGFDAGSCTYEVVGSQQFKQEALKPEEFAQICRDLDLGMQYQWHLNRVFDPVDEHYSMEDTHSKAFKLHQKFSENLHHEFMCELHIAFMKGEMIPTHYKFLLKLLGSTVSLLSNFSLAYSTLQIMAFEVPGVLVFWPQRRPIGQSQTCLLYLPGSPIRTFQAFDSFDLLKATLRQWLNNREFSQYFFQLVPLRHRAEFMRRTDAKNMTWDSLLLRRPPIINEPALMSETGHRSQTKDPFIVTWGLQLAKIKDDATLLIVPTEEEDSKSRLSRQASFLNLGLSLLTLTLGFVPVIGELLLVISVIQLGEEIYDGIKAWQRGDQVAALEHLFDVAQNVALAAGTGAIAKVLKPSPIVDALAPIKSVSGQTRLWRPDLELYALKNVSLEGVKPNAQGIYTIRTSQFIKLDGQVFEVTNDTTSQQWLIKHPSDSEAYRPRLNYNESGAWTHELDNPMQWSRLELFRRLGPEAQGFSDTSAAHIMAASNTGDDVLRKVYIDNLELPPLLADSMERVRIIEKIERFIVDMKQGVARGADNAVLQLELLTQLPGWPPSKVLRVVDEHGAVVKEYGSDLLATHPRLQMTEAQINNGDLLTATLEALSTEQVHTLLGRSLDVQQQQVKALVQQLGELAQSKKTALFALIYARDEVLTPEMSSLRAQFPSLPSRVMAELIKHMTAAELSTLQSNGRFPMSVLEEARRHVQMLRLNRALEGLYFQGLSSADSNSLVFHTITGLEGWPTNVRLVLRDKATSAVLESVGGTSALYSREFFKTGEEYEFYLPNIDSVKSSSHLSECIAQSLSTTELQSLGLPAPESSKRLSHKIADFAAIHRTLGAKALGLQRIKPWFKSPLRLADSRVGYTLGGRSSHVSRESRALMLRDLVSQLYPQMSEEQVGQFLLTLDMTPELTAGALGRLKAELDKLHNDLNNWMAKPVWSQPRIGPAVLVPLRDKRAMSLALIQAWRRQSERTSFGDRLGYVLNLNAWPVDSLPTLSANFDHVTELHLSHSPSGKFPAGFLQKFPQLRVLSLRNNQLSELPAEVSGMTELLDLNLQGNQIVLTDRSSAVLSGLTKLKTLNLTGNNLGRRISVRRMTALEHLYLRYTESQTWPEGVEALVLLQTLDLRDNAISRIPLEVLTAERNPINRITHLHDNPLSADSLRRLDIYRREQRIDFGIAPRRQHTVQTRSIYHWANQPTSEENGIWNDLSGHDGSTDFFRVLEDLSTSSDYLHGRANLSQRVWRILNAMHDNSELRTQLFEVSANPNTCADGVPMIFSDLELRFQIFTALCAPNAEEELLKLAQGLFRIDLLNTHVQGIIDARVALVHSEQQGYVQELQRLIDADSRNLAPRPLADMTPQEQQEVAYRLGTQQALRLAQRLSPIDLQARIDRVEPLEVQMYYHVKLARELGLPARPKSMIFEKIANVTSEQLKAAKQHVLNEDTAPAKIAFIEKQSFWESFLEKKYPGEFQVIDSPLHARMQVLYVAREKLSSQQYVSQTEKVGRNRLREREALVRRLTRMEIDEHPLAEVLSSSSSDI